LSDSTGQQQGGWARRREYRSTYRDSLTGGETLVAGRMWGPEPRAAAGRGRLVIGNTT
jgi:hypothetical protein